jgi:hypothetical protein
MGLGYEDSLKKEHRRKNSQTKIVEANPFDKVRFSNFGSKQEAIYKLVKDI